MASVGDLMAVGKLAHEIAVALSECRRAAAEYQSLIELLTSLRNSVSLVSNFMSTLSVSAAVHVDHAFMNGIFFHAERCRILLNQFMVDSRKYTESLINGQGNKVRTSYRKVKWCLYSAEDARKLEQRLSTHLEAFDRYLLAVNIQVGAQSTERLERQVGQISYALTEISESVRKTQLNMPKVLGYPWERDIASSYVHLNDVLGRSIILPAVLCRTFQTLHDTLRIMFSDHPGFGKVDKGEFELIDETNDSTVFQGGRIGQQSPLHVGIKPGARLSMSILSVKTVNAQRDSLIPSVQIIERCPSCGFPSSGRRFRKCLNCSLRFRKTVLERGGKWIHGWPRSVIPQRPTNTSPLSLGKTSHKMITGKSEVGIGGDVPPTEADMESKFILRVHHITEYVVPIRFARPHEFKISRLPLIQAIGQGNLQWVRHLLLHADTDPNCRSFRGWKALQFACSIPINSIKSKNQKAIIELLIAHGADVNAVPVGIITETALQLACQRGNEEVVDILLKNGAEINPEIGFRNALAKASGAGSLGIVKKLIDLGADIQHPDVLSAAAKKGNLGIVNYLIERGADLHGYNGLKALEATISEDHLAVARRFLELGVNVNAEVDGSAPINAVQSLCMLDMLVVYGARVNAPYSRSYQETALQRAARNCDQALVTELIRLGADVHHPGSENCGRTALQSVLDAAGYHDTASVIETLRLLIAEHGADVNEPKSNKEGFTSLEAACDRTVKLMDHSDIAAVEFLVERGAKVTPLTLHIAAARNHETLGGFLLQNGARTEDLRRPADIKIPSWEKHYGFGSTVIETAKLNGHHELAEKLEGWVDAT